MSIEAVQQTLGALGSAWRNDWSDFDGRTLRSQLNEISAALDPASSVTYEALCRSLGICPVHHEWAEGCYQCR